MTESRKVITSDDIRSLISSLSNYLEISDYRIKKFTKNFSVDPEPPEYYADYDELSEHLFNQILASDELKKFLEYMMEQEISRAGHYQEFLDKYFPETPDGTYSVNIPSIRNSRISSNPNYGVDPTIFDSEYIRILNAIQIFGSEMEKKIITFYKQLEEGHRDTILTGLQTAFPKYSASAETFNIEGKTDILLKHGGLGNMFVAECKIWNGPASVTSAIKQLMNNLSWRDSKTALLLFIKTSNFSSILDQMVETVSKHPHFKEHIDTKNENCFNFIFTQKDKSKTFKLAVICFNFYYEQSSKRKTTK